MLSAPVYSDIEVNSADFTEKIYHLSVFVKVLIPDQGDEVDLIPAFGRRTN